MYVDIKYQTGQYKMPAFETTPSEEKKKPDWFIAVAEWIYSQHLQDKTAIPSSLSSRFELMRLYGAGRQPSDFYREKLSGRSSSSSTDTLQSDRQDKQKGWENIDFDNIVSVMPLIKSVSITTAAAVDHDIQCDAIDMMSGSEEEKKMWRRWTMVEDGPALQALAKQFSIPIEVDDIMPEDFEDLKQIRAEGGFKAEHAIELEEVIKFTEQVSQWDEQLHRDLINEIFDNGYGCAYECFDEETKTSQWKFSYPEDTIKQNSKSKKFNDTDFEGVLIDYSISHMRSLFPDKDDAYWTDIAKQFKTYNNVQIAFNSSNLSGSYTNQYYSQPHDEDRVPVLYFRYNDVEKEDYVQFETSRGEKRILDYNEKERYSSKQKKYTHRRRVSRTAKWVIGTKLIFDEGNYPNQPEENTRPKDFIKIYQYPYESMTWRLKSILDQLQIAWLKYQNALSISFPGGIAIDMGMIKTVADQMKGDELDIIKMVFERGILPYTYNPMLRQGGGQVSPVQELPSNVVKALTDYISIIDQMFVLVEKLTGLSPISLGATPAKDQLVGTAELSYASTIKALSDVSEGCKIIKQGLSEYTAERLKIAFEVDEDVRHNYESIIGADGVDLIRKATKRNVQYGYKLIARPTEIEKQAIIEQANISNQKYMNNQPGITEGQKARVMFMLSSGVNLKMISRYMDAWIKKDEKVKHQLGLEKEQAQTNALGQLDDRQTQNYGRKKAIDLQYEKDLSKLKSDLKVNEITVQEDEDRRTEAMKKEKDKEIEKLKLASQ